MKIELTSEQAAAFKRGESITITPDVKHYIVVRDDGGIFRYDTIGGQPQPWTVVRKSRSIYMNEGETSTTSYDFKQNSMDTVIEVEA